MKIRSMILVTLLACAVYSQDSTKTETPVGNDWPPGFEQTIVDLDFANLTLDLVLRAIAQKYRLNLFIEEGQKYRTTMRLSDISVKDALEVIADQYEYQIKISNGVVRLLKPVPEIDVPQKPILSIVIAGDSLSIDVEKIPLNEILNEISELASVNIILPPDIKSEITMKFSPIPLEKGLGIILASAQLKYEKKDDIFFIKKTFKYVEGGKNKKKSGTYYLDVNGSSISLEAIDTPLETILMEIANQLALDIVFIKPVTGEVNAKFSNVDKLEVMDVLFKGTNFTYRKEGDLYFIGDRSQLDMNCKSSEHLGHI